MALFTTHPFRLPNYLNNKGDSRAPVAPDSYLLGNLLLE